MNGRLGEVKPGTVVPISISPPRKYVLILNNSMPCSGRKPEVSEWVVENLDRLHRDINQPYTSERLPVP
jgi:hypothetical protein